MSIPRLIAAAGGLAVAFAAAPMSALHAQATPRQDTPTNRSWGAPTVARPQAGLEVRADSAFIREAGAGNLLEIRLGNLAERKATSPAVKQFGQRMVTDHTTMGNQWGTLVAANRLPPASLDQAQEQQVSGLERLSGPEFDRAYMTAMIQDHQRDVETFQSLGPSAHSAEVRQLAANGLATIQQHLTMATQVGSTVGAGTNVVVAPRNPPVTGQNGQVAPQRVQGGSDELKADRKIVTDREIVEEVGADNTLEVRLGQTAQRKASNSAVKRFAERMVDDFTRWQDRWTGMASRNGMPLKPGMGRLHQQKLEPVQKQRSGAEFDRIYMTTVIQHLQYIEHYFQNAGKSARSAPVQRLVADQLAAVRQNLAQARRIGDQVKADTGRERNVSAKK